MLWRVALRPIVIGRPLSLSLSLAFIAGSRSVGRVLAVLLRRVLLVLIVGRRIHAPSLVLYTVTVSVRVVRCRRWVVVVAGITLFHRIIILLRVKVRIGGSIYQLTTITIIHFPTIHWRLRRARCGHYCGTNTFTTPTPTEQLFRILELNWALFQPSLHLPRTQPTKNTKLRLQIRSNPSPEMPPPPSGPRGWVPAAGGSKQTKFLSNFQKKRGQISRKPKPGK